MSRFLSKNYDTLVPYTPGEQVNVKVIKLNTNESPFPPSPKVKEVLSEEVIDKLNLYSDPELKELRNAIAREFGVTADMVFCGNGSDDVLAFAIMGFCGRGGKLCCPEISYGFYPVYADIFGVDLEQIPLKDDFSIDVNDYIGKGKNIVIANPNAPTGLALSFEDVEKIVASNPDNIVIMDEAYMAFCGESCMELVNKYGNLLVTRTFSKSHSLAGLRVGFGIGSKEIIDDLNKLKYSFNPYNINTLSIKAAAAAIADNEYYDDKIAKIVATREKTMAQLRESGFTCTESKANFIFASSDKIPASDLASELRKRGILIRYFNKAKIDNYLRITVGTDEEMQTLVNAIKEIIK
ncbi:MAG: histidinol-phosphate transaminase [Ruminococcaceae bacterium]|nr:histidinol-phosphate transaminase [Oscillospiraceae bacterium]